MPGITLHFKYLFFATSFNKFGNTGTWMLDSIYDTLCMALINSLRIPFIGVKLLRFCHTTQIAQTTLESHLLV